MKQVHMNALTRSNQGGRRSTLHGLRKTGWIPAVLYGGTQPPMSISVPERALAGDIGAESRFVELSVEGQALSAIIKEVQRHPVSGKIIHADFYRTDSHHKTEVEVPVQVHGIEAAQKRGLIVQQQTRTILVRALPQNLPENIPVDVSSLKIGHHLTIGEVALPDGVELLTDKDEVLVSALAPSRGAAAQGEESAQS